MDGCRYPAWSVRGDAGNAPIRDEFEAMHTQRAMIPGTRAGLLLGLLLVLAQLGGCGGGGGAGVGGSGDGGYLAGDRPPDEDRDVSTIPDAVPRVEPRSRYGNPKSYEVFGKTYHVMASGQGYKERGTASWYGKKFHGRLTSNREPYDMFAMTAAHKTLPLPTYVRVTNLDNGRSVVVRVNDRGPFHGDRIIDLSYAAAKKLGVAQKGTGRVEVVALDPNQPSRQVLAATEPQPAPAPRQPAGYVNPNERELARPAPAGPDPATAPPPGPIETVTEAAPQGSDAGAVYLQLGAFSSEANARRLVTQLQDASVTNASVQPGSGSAGPIYRVRVGPLSSLKDADQLSVQINTLGIGQPHVVID